MKHFLMMTYNIYFILLMIVPCNHTVLYGQIAQKALGISLTSDCQHEHHHEHKHHNHQDDHSSDHHHACTPFCACGISTFVLNKPSIDLQIHQCNCIKYRILPTESLNWAPTPNIYKQLMVNDIWHPPQLV